MPTEPTTISGAYDEWAESYDQDRNLTRDLDQRVTREQLSHFRCRSILELGCGTGKNTSFLAEIGERVDAWDFSAGMLAQAQANITASNVRFVQTDITARWPSAEASADLIVCNLVLEHVADLPFVFAEASRTLVCGGRFFVCELHPYRQYQHTQARFERGGKTIAIPAFVHHVSEYLHAARSAGLSLLDLNEWWHESDADAPPRLISWMFTK